MRLFIVFSVPNCISKNNMRPEAKLNDDIQPPQSPGQLLVSGGLLVANMFFSQANSVVANMISFTDDDTMLAGSVVTT